MHVADRCHYSLITQLSKIIKIIFSFSNSFRSRWFPLLVPSMRRSMSRITWQMTRICTWSLLTSPSHISVCMRLYRRTAYLDNYNEPWCRQACRIICTRYIHRHWFINWNMQPHFGLSLFDHVAIIRCTTPSLGKKYFCSTFSHKLRSLMPALGGAVAYRQSVGLAIIRSWVWFIPAQGCIATLGYTPLSPSSITWYRSKDGNVRLYSGISSEPNAP